jgi:hypothetical protein
MEAVDQLVKKGDAAAAEGKLEVCAESYEKASEALLGLDKKAEELEQLAKQRVAAEHEAAKKRYADVSAGIDRERLNRHVPGSEDKVKPIVEEAKALAEQGKIEESTAKYREAADKLTELGKQAETLEKARLAALAEKLKAEKEAYDSLAVKTDMERAAKYAPEDLQALKDLAKEAGSLSEKDKTEESAAKYQEAKAKLAALDKKAQELERAAIAADMEAARKRYLELAEKADKALIAKFLKDAQPEIERLAQEAADLAGEERLEASMRKYREATGKLEAAEKKAKELQQAAIAAAKASQEAAKGKYAELSRKTDEGRLRKFEPEAVSAVAQLVKEADDLAAQGKFDEGAAKYSEAEKQLAAADQKAKEKELADLAARKEKLAAAKKSYAELAGATNREHIQRFLPEEAKALDESVRQAEGLAADGKLDEGAAKFLELADRLKEMEKNALQLREERQRKLQEKVGGEMEQIREHLDKDEVAPALEKLTRTLLSEWMKHRKGDWAEFLAFVRECQAKSPMLDVMGRTRLKVLEKKLETYIKEEESWRKLLAAVQEAQQNDTKWEKVRQYILENPETIYRTDAEKLLADILKKP